MKSRLAAGLALLVAALFAPGSSHAADPAGFPSGHREALGPLFEAQAPAAPVEVQTPSSTQREMIRHWNEVAVDASGLDHTPVASGDPRIFGEQLGPARASRAMAIVHVAVFEAVNAIVPRYRSYLGTRLAAPGTSMNAAVAQAAHDTLSALFPSQRTQFAAQLAADLGRIPEGLPKRWGIQLGRRTAAESLARRADDGSAHAELRIGVEYLTQDGAGYWRQDPISLVPIALGARWDEVRPFVLRSARQFRIAPPPAMDSAAYAAAYAEVKALGGDGITTPTTRSPEQTLIGIYWAYDGTPSLCAPPRLYNQVAMQVADQMRTGPVELARLLALVNVAMADAGIASWESKYYYEVWRPVTAIRESDPGTGPSGSGDGNPATIGDIAFRPLGAPASNLVGPNFTPPFPAYPSGHATFGAALFQVLRRFYGRDDVAFSFVSDEYNGITVDNAGNIRPLIPRNFSSFSQAEEENGQSRIYLGIHWSFDKTAGIAQGRRVGNFVYEHAFQPWF